MFFRITIGLVACSAAFAQAPEFKPSVDTEKKPWTHLNFKNDARNFQFAIVTDRTGGHRDGVFEQGVARLNLLQPEFVMSVGDLIEGYTEDLKQLDREWTEFIGLVDALEMPFFYVPGNHDITNDVMTKEWERRFGRSYYHFVYGDVLFLGLNSEDPPASQMSDAQVEYMREALEENQDVRWTMVFLHKPLWTGNVEENGWGKMEALLKGRPHNVYAGHTHDFHQYARNDAQYIVLATMGGGSELRGPNFGEFDHFMWVTMTDEGPIMANLMLDGVWDTNIITEERIGILQPLLSGQAIKTDGIVVDSSKFEKASSNLRLTNDADIPMKVELTLPSTDDLKSSVRRVSTTIAPNSVELVPFDLVAAREVSVYDLEPMRASWTVEYKVEGNLNPVRVRGSHRILVDTAYELESARNVTVDGNLAEWDELAVIPAGPGQVVDDKERWTGNDDAALQFEVAYTKTHLVIGARIVDEQIVLDTRRNNMNRQDHVAIGIDPSGGDNTGEPIVIRMSPGQTFSETQGGENLPSGTNAVCVKTDEGYAIELELPLSALDSAQGGKWESVRLNIGVNDVDSEGLSQIWWRPKWGDPADYAGSGVFKR